MFTFSISFTLTRQRQAGHQLDSAGKGLEDSLAMTLGFAAVSSRDTLDAMNASHVCHPQVTFSKKQVDCGHAAALHMPIQYETTK